MWVFIFGFCLIGSTNNDGLLPSLEVLAKVLAEKETLTKEEIEDIVEANSNIKIKKEEKISDEDKEIKEVEENKEETPKKTKKQTKTEE